MNPKSLFALPAIAGMACLFTACTPARQKFSVGGGTSTEHQLLTEIMAQQVESRTGLNVIRKAALPGTSAVQQGLLGGEIDLYAEATTAVMADVLREVPDRDRNIVRDRLRTELDRVAQTTLVTSLGYDSPFSVVIRSSEADEKHLKTISDACDVKTGWDFATSAEYQGRADAAIALQSAYRLPFRSTTRSMPLPEAFRMLKEGHISMVGASATEGILTTPDFRLLIDDKGTMPAAEMCIFTRNDVLKARPELSKILGDLKGRLTTESIRKANWEIDGKHRTPKDVAADLLAGRLK